MTEDSLLAAHSGLIAKTAACLHRTCGHHIEHDDLLQEVSICFLEADAPGTRQVGPLSLAMPRLACDAESSTNSADKTLLAATNATASTPSHEARPMD